MDHKTKMERNLDMVLGLIDGLPDGADSEQQVQVERTPMEVVVYEEVMSSVTVSEDMTGEERDRVSDYQFARTVSHRLVEKGISALELAMVLAKESEHPKTFDTINNLILTISQVSKDMMSLHKKPGSPTPGKQNASVINNTQNNISIQKDNDPKSISEMLDGLGDILPKEEQDNG